MQGGTGAKVGWLGLVEFDVDRPRSRATDGHSVNATRKTKNQAFGRHKSGFIRPDEGKIYDGRAPRVWARHAPRLAVAERAIFFALGAERRIASRGRFLCRSVLAARNINENKVVVICVHGSRQKTREVGAVRLRWNGTASIPARRRKKTNELQKTSAAGDAKATHV